MFPSCTDTKLNGLLIEDVLEGEEESGSHDALSNLGTDT